MRSLQVVLWIGLFWMVTAAGAVEPLAEVTTPSPAVAAPKDFSPPAHGTITGKVTQTLEVPHYTYVEVDTGKDLIWIAGPITEVQVGDSVEAPNGIQMVDFHSPTLDRSFEVIYLVPAIQVK